MDPRQSDQLDRLFTQVLQATAVCPNKRMSKVRLCHRAICQRLRQNIEQDVLQQRRVFLSLGTLSLIPTDIRI